MNKTNERQAYQCPKINVIPINLSNSFASDGSGLKTSINGCGNRRFCRR
ncbi:MAG: hypothetical protein LKJ87_03850 [Bacteroidales bacterium]|nr:hypothetical protein [Bacteroidales bacterium]